MKLTTTFWSKKTEEFDHLMYINGQTKKIIFKTDLNDSFATYIFFKNVAKFIKSSVVLNTINSNEDFYQFGVMDKNELIHIKWFNLIINEKTIISHDIAFETTLINKNNVKIPFGYFPNYYYKKNINIPKYREFNIKSRAYKYIANQVKKNLF